MYIRCCLATCVAFCIKIYITYSFAFCKHFALHFALYFAFHCIRHYIAIHTVWRMPLVSYRFTYKTSKPCAIFLDFYRYLIVEATPAIQAILTKRRVSSAKAFEHVHREFAVLFRVASSDSIVDVDRLETRLRELYLYIVQNFKWARISETTHAFLAHTAEQIRLNGNVGLCTLGEQGSESKINITILQ